MPTGLERTAMKPAFHLLRSVLAALADDRSIAGHLFAENDITPDHRLVSAFRIGRRTGPSQQRARLPLDEILV